MLATELKKGCQRVSALLEIEGLEKYFAVRQRGLFQREKKVVRAVDRITFNIRHEETLGLVGESGCGKTTLGRLLLRLIEPTAGTVRFMGHDIFNLDKGELRKLRRNMQMIFQDPFTSLNPRKTVRKILSAPFAIHRTVEEDAIKDKVLDLLEAVGLNPASSYIDRYPHEVSGGQKQRIGIARAIALHPSFIVADEPVSSLDVSVRAQILNLMKQLKEEYRYSCLYITHDLATVRSVTNRVAVMYMGKIVELAEVEELFDTPLHPYTRALLSAVPVPNPKFSLHHERVVIKGGVPSSVDPSGCRFHPRCIQAKPICHEQEPPIIEVRSNHRVACWQQN